MTGLAAVMFLAYYAIAVLAVATHPDWALRAAMTGRRFSLAMANRAAYATIAAGFVCLCAVVLAMARLHLVGEAVRAAGSP